MHETERHTPARLYDARRDEMKTPEEVTAMARLKSLGWGVRRIAAELGCSKNTVRRWIREGDWRRCSTASRSKRLDGLTDWLDRVPLRGVAATWSSCSSAGPAGYVRRP
jgi:hypothetical protein